MRIKPMMTAKAIQVTYKKTPHPMISRAICGIRGSSLIVNLPGSPKSVKEI